MMLIVTVCCRMSTLGDFLITLGDNRIAVR